MKMTPDECASEIKRLTEYTATLSLEKSEWLSERGLYEKLALASADLTANIAEFGTITDDCYIDAVDDAHEALRDHQALFSSPLKKLEIQGANIGQFAPEIIAVLRAAYKYRKYCTEELHIAIKNLNEYIEKEI